MIKCKSIVLALSLLISFCTSGNQTFKDVADKQSDIPSLQNSNIDAFVSAQELLGKKTEIIYIDAPLVYISATDSYGKELLYGFNYISNVVESVNDYNKSKTIVKRAFDLSDISNACKYTYTSDGQLSSVSTGESKYELTYDKSGLVNKQISNGNELVTKTYSNNLLVKTDYINGTEVVKKYNDSGLKLSTAINNNVVAKFEYTGNLLTKYTDLQTNTTYKYEYNSENRVSSMNSSDGLEIKYVYDCNRELILKRQYNFLGNSIMETSIEENGIKSSYLSSASKKDISDRIVNRIFSLPNGRNFSEKYIYVVKEPTYDELAENNYENAIDNRTRDVKVKNYSNPVRSFEYAYDAEDNIVSSINGDNMKKYIYSSNGELTGYQDDNMASHYDYDDYGNITHKDGQTFTYSQSNGLDELIGYNNYAFKYDSNGNPTIYKSKDLKWEGKNLIDFGGNQYTYNESGMRTSKKTNGAITKYQLEGNKVIFEKKEGKAPVVFVYDNNEIMGFIYSGKQYFYEKNLQKDVLDIADENGKVVVTYEYDPWGKVTKIAGALCDTIGELNPYLYRSYRYDFESSLYYLGTRYYDPDTGRFISPDDISNLEYTVLSDASSKNLYAYASNNPINRVDPHGDMSHGILNALKFLYSDLRLINDKWISTPCLMLNANNIYLGFHETAQLVAAKQLSETGYVTQLEYSTSNGYADVLAFRGANYLYEVKPITASSQAAITQLGKYIKATGFLAGPNFATYEIDFLPKIKMQVYCEGNGIVRYAFYKEQWKWFNRQVKVAIDESKVENGIKVGFWVGVAAAGAMIAATLVEDVITAGAGVADDAASIGVASGAFRTAVSFGLAFV